MVRSGGCFRREPTAETVQVGSRKPTRPRTNFPKFPSKRAGVHLQAGCRDAVHADQHADPAGAYAAPLKKKKKKRQARSIWTFQSNAEVRPSRRWKLRVVRGRRPVIGLPEKSAFVGVVFFFCHAVLNLNHMLPHCRPLGAHVRNASV